MVPRALQIAIDEDVEFRRGLPREYSSYMGIAHSDMVSSVFFLFSNTIATHKTGNPRGLSNYCYKNNYNTGDSR